MKRFATTIFTLLIITAIVMAQDNQCPVVQQAAVSEAGIWCADFDLGQACYGNSSVSAETLSDAQCSAADHFIDGYDSIDQYY